MYEIIEKNEYGVLIKNKTDNADCQFCKYKKQNFYISDIPVCMKRHECTDDSYYLTDLEAAKLETEKQKPLADEIISIQKEKINMLEQTLKQLCESQKELIDLQIENKKLKEKCKSEYQRGVEDGKIIAEHGTTMYQD